MLRRSLFGFAILLAMSASTLSGVLVRPAEAATVSLGDSVQVVPPVGRCTILRAGPGFLAARIGCLAAGTTGYTVAGPVFRDGQRWWLLVLGLIRPNTGWVTDTTLMVYDGNIQLVPGVPGGTGAGPTARPTTATNSGASGAAPISSGLGSAAASGISGLGGAAGAGILCLDGTRATTPAGCAQHGGLAQ